MIAARHREYELYFRRRVLELQLTEVVLAYSRLDRLDAAIDRSAERMKVLAKQLMAEPFADLGQRSEAAE